MGDGPIVNVSLRIMDAILWRKWQISPYKKHQKLAKLAWCSETPSFDACCGHDAPHYLVLSTGAKSWQSHKDLWKRDGDLHRTASWGNLFWVQKLGESGLYTTHCIQRARFSIWNAHRLPFCHRHGRPQLRSKNRAGTYQLWCNILGKAGHGSTPNVANRPIVMASLGYHAISKRFVE